MTGNHTWRKGILALMGSGGLLLASAFALLFVRGNSESTAVRLSALEREVRLSDEELRKVELSVKEATQPVSLARRVEGRMGPANRDRIVRLQLAGNNREGGTN